MNSALKKSRQDMWVNTYHAVYSALFGHPPSAAEVARSMGKSADWAHRRLNELSLARLGRSTYGADGRPHRVVS